MKGLDLTDLGAEPELRFSGTGGVMGGIRAKGCGASEREY